MDGNQPLFKDRRLVDYIKSDVLFMEGIKRGVAAWKEGKVRRWSDIKRELRL